MTLKVTVLLPVYNAEKYLKEAVQSILDQTFENFELLIINDGSTDNSSKILCEFDDPRIHIHNNEKNIGLIATLNIGLTIAKGSYIARMDADDISIPDRLQKEVDFLDNNLEYIIVGSNCIYFGTNVGRSATPIEDTDIRLSLIFNSPFIHPSVMFRKEAVLQEGLQFDKNFIHMEDWAFWRKLLKLGKGKNIDEPLIRYRLSESNISIINRHTAMERYSKFYQILFEDLGLPCHAQSLEFHFRLCYGKAIKREDFTIFKIFVSDLKRHLLMASFSEKMVDNVIAKKLKGMFYSLAHTSFYAANKFAFKNRVLTMGLFTFSLKLLLHRWLKSKK